MLLLATFMVFLPACSDDKDEPEDIKSQIIGTWDAASVKFSDTDWVDISSFPSMALSITFNKDGSYYGVVHSAMAVAHTQCPERPSKHILMVNSTEHIM